MPEDPDMDKTPRSLLRENLSIGFSKELLVKSPKFKVGDIVKLKTGTAPIKVTGVSNSHLLKYNISGRYVNTSHTILLRSEEEFEFYNNEEENNMSTLYQFTVDSDTKYGTYLATNSQGLSVMEEKGTGVIYTVAKTSVEEVLPYTIDVVFLLTGNKTEYSYLAPAGKYQVGEVFLLESKYGHGLCVITNVDTKSKAATTDFNPITKVLTEKV